MRERYRVFAEEYLRSWNLTQAAIAAGYSSKTAAQLGYKVRHKPQVEDYIRRRLAGMQMETDEILVRITDQARGSLEPFIPMDDEGKLQTDNGFLTFDFSTPRAQKSLFLIRRVKTARTRRVDGRTKDKIAWEDEKVEIELYDAQNALELLGRANNLFNDKIPVETPLVVIGLQEILNKVYKDDGSGTKR